MKQLLVAFLIFLIGTQSYAQKEPSVLEAIVEQMAKQYIESAAKTEVIKQLEAYASEVLAKDLSGSISNALAILGLIENVQQYDKASSETARYQAFSQGVANAVTIANPAVGALVRLGLLGEGLSAALVSRNYSLELARMQAEIASIEKKTSDLILEEFQIEQKTFLNLLARSNALSTLISQNSKVIDDVCFAKTVSKDNNSQKCLENSLLHQNLLYLQVKTFQKIVTFKGRFIGNLVGLNKEKLEEINKLLKDAETGLNKALININQSMHLYSNTRVFEIRNSVPQKNQFFRCERLITDELMAIYKAEMLFRQNEEFSWIETLMQERKENLKSLIDVDCSKFIDQLDPDLQKLILAY